jgi:hypothetical protein
VDAISQRIPSSFFVNPQGAWHIRVLLFAGADQLAAAWPRRDQISSVAAHAAEQDAGRRRATQSCAIEGRPFGARSLRTARMLVSTRILPGSTQDAAPMQLQDFKTLTFGITDNAQARG